MSCLKQVELCDNFFLAFALLSHQMKLISFNRKGQSFAPFWHSNFDPAFYFIGPLEDISPLYLSSLVTSQTSGESRLQWKLFCGQPALCWIKEIDCRDRDFWERPAFRKGDMISKLDFPWGHSRPFIHQKSGLGGCNLVPEWKVGSFPMNTSAWFRGQKLCC